MRKGSTLVYGVLVLAVVAFHQAVNALAPVEQPRTRRQYFGDSVAASLGLATAAAATTTAATVAPVWADVASEKVR